MVEITQYNPLIFATTYEWETYLKQCSLKQWHQIADSDFVSFEWWIEIRKNQIKAVWNATSAQYFETHVLPWLSQEYKEEYEKIKWICPKDIKHSVILDTIKRNHERKKYEEEMNRPPTQKEIEQRKKIIELYRIKLWIWATQ